ncbi:hypothetical protein VNO80_13581 [Phaseolus coccineus]|uniref:Uncharacterized protein n=1 Tax=Phaseolus coccineus TaxID=3886 RepID=A0AAN9N6I3_PHACN
MFLFTHLWPTIFTLPCFSWRNQPAPPHQPTTSSHRSCHHSRHRHPAPCGSCQQQPPRTAAAPLSTVRTSTPAPPTVPLRGLQPPMPNHANSSKSRQPPHRQQLAPTPLPPTNPATTAPRHDLHPPATAHTAASTVHIPHHVVGRSRQPHALHAATASPHASTASLPHRQPPFTLLHRQQLAPTPLPPTNRRRDAPPHRCLTANRTTSPISTTIYAAFLRKCQSRGPASTVDALQSIGQSQTKEVRSSHNTNL